MPFHNLADPTRKLRRALGMKTILGQDRSDQPFPDMPDELRKFLSLPGKGSGGEHFPRPSHPDPSASLPPGAITNPVEPPRSLIDDQKVGEPGPSLTPRSGDFPIKFPTHGTLELLEDPVNSQPRLPEPVPGDTDDSAQEDLGDRLSKVFAQIVRLRRELKNNLQNGEPGKNTTKLQGELIRLQALAQQLNTELGDSDRSLEIPQDSIPTAPSTGAFTAIDNEDRPTVKPRRSTESSSTKGIQE